MLSLLFICLIGGGIGATLQGMVGIGTGIVVIPMLSFVLPHYGISQDLSVHIALATSMAAIVINSLSALVTHHKRGNIQWGLFRKIIIYCSIGSFLGALLASTLSGRSLETFFGLFMLVLAFYMLAKKPISDQSDKLPALKRKTMVSGGLSIGFIASILGTGGGVLMIPFFHALKVKMSQAVGTSTLISLPISIIGATTYIFAGMSHTPASIPTIGYLHWPAFLAITTAGVVCAPLGAKLATRVPARLLQQIFSVCMIVVGIKMIW